MKETPFPFRFVEVRGVRYLRLDDVAMFLRELGGAEETDVRNRLDEAARRMITAESITDDQIRALRDELVSEIARLASTPEAWTMPLDKALVETDWALSTAMQPAIVDRRRAARSRCAEIFNTRKAAS